MSGVDAATETPLGEWNEDRGNKDVLLVFYYCVC